MVLAELNLLACCWMNSIMLEITPEKERERVELGIMVFSSLIPKLINIKCRH